LARLFRDLSEQTQREFARTTGIEVSLLARYELDLVEPGLDHLARLAEGARLTIAKGEEVLRVVDELREPRRRVGTGIESLLAELSAEVSRSYQRLLRLPLPLDSARSEDGGQASDPNALRDPERA
jgi:transcriptional regulator with XRE-family HTH domain